MHIGYLWESHKERNHWEDQDVGGGWIILKWILGWSGMNWIDLAQDRDQWSAIVNMAMNLWVPNTNAGKFLSSCTTGDFSRRAQLL
jgi:hypothetical protein